jgi:hypothetical protein
LDRREQAFRVITEQSGKGDKAGRDSAEEQVRADPGERSKERDLELDRSAGEDRVGPGGGHPRRRVA